MQKKGSSHLSFMVDGACHFIYDKSVWHSAPLITILTVRREVQLTRTRTHAYTQASSVYRFIEI